MIADSYEAGTVAKKLGVVSGRDMTLEAAVGKLVYLASLDLGYHEVIKKIGENLRGELTEKTSEIGFLSIL
jgi:L-asparaginase